MSKIMAQRSRDRLAHIHQHLQPSSFRSTDTTAGPAAGQLESIECAGIHETRAVLAASLPLKTSFPQATTLPTFPPSVSDYLQLDELLLVEDVELRKRAREMMEKHVAPVMTEYCEKQEFPFQVVPHIASLSIGGSWTKGYGCAGLSKLSNGVALAEIARVDASIASFVLIHSHLVVNTIAMLGNEEQKLKYLPSLARFDTIGCWAMTEPGYGSDASSMSATATKVEGGWLLNGQKRWPGNCTFADIAVVFARNTTTNQINGFIVKNDTPGYQAAKIKNKIAMRIMQNGDITLKDVFVSEEDRIPGVKAFQDINEILWIARIMVMWQALGISMGVYDACFRYLQERHQFKVPLASFQICQEKLVRMLGNIQAISLMSWRVTNMYDAGKMSPGQASLGKAWTTLRARETVALGRELMGANGILLDFHVAKAFCDLEVIYTYDGSYEINTLITGREITGISCIKPAPQSTPKPKEHLVSLM